MTEAIVEDPLTEVEQALQALLDDVNKVADHLAPTSSLPTIKSPTLQAADKQRLEATWCLREPNSLSPALPENPSHRDV